MSPKGEVATRRATEPNELYDSLSQESKDIWDEIGALGFTPEKGFGNMWFARKTGSKAKEAIGPAEHIAVLLTMVKEAVADAGEIDGGFLHTDDEIEITETDKGPRLPGVPYVADRQIVDAAGKFKALNNEWKEKGKERTNAQKDLIAICHAKPQLFKKDPNNSSAKIYDTGSMIIRLKNTVKEQVEVELIETEDGD